MKKFSTLLFVIILTACAPQITQEEYLATSDALKAELKLTDEAAPPRPVQRVTQSSGSPSIRTCQTGYFSMAEDAKLFKNVDRNSANYGDYYHVVPRGDPVGATGRCTSLYAEVMHLGKTGWVYKKSIS